MYGGEFSSKQDNAKFTTKSITSTHTPAQDLLDQLVATIGDVYSFTRVQLESTGSTWVPYEAVRPGLRIAVSTYRV
jgi:hypothetical protein